jgi:L-fuconolactonase
MRIDAHQHVWDLAIRPQPWTEPFPILARSYDLDDLRPALDACEIDGTIVVQTVTVKDETPELLALAEVDPRVLGVVGWVDLSAADVMERLQSLGAGSCGKNLVGIRHQAQEESGSTWFFQPDVRNGLRAVAAQGLTYDLIVRPDQLDGARSVAQAIPELDFVLDHGGNPDIQRDEFDGWRDAITALAALPNVSAKLSGLVTRAAESWSVERLRPYADHLISAFGPHRVLFGSDWPVCLLRGGYEQIFMAAVELIASLSSDEQTAILGGNAATWYHLGRDR